jgi:hypothetical protein
MTTKIPFLLPWMRGGDDNLHGFGVVSALDGLVYEAVRADDLHTGSEGGVLVLVEGEDE